MSNTIKYVFFTTLLTFLFLKAFLPKNTAEAASLVSNVVPADKVKWGYLNPLRGTKSPGAADLWGDRSKNEATGMLVRFNKGFSSPPHIHNITYRGIVIKGLMHNDDPNAEEMWLPSGSFWTQPAGENHITAANGKENLIYLEIDSGPYLVKPVENQFDNGERPVNIHSANLVWLSETESLAIKGKGVKLSYLWKSNNETNLEGVLVKIPKGFNGKIETDSSEFRGVVIHGTVNYSSVESKKPIQLTPGSYFSSSNIFSHKLTSKSEATIYVRANNQFKVVAEK